MIFFHEYQDSKPAFLELKDEYHMDAANRFEAFLELQDEYHMDATKVRSIVLAGFPI
jgi:hypothetical protein